MQRISIAIAGLGLVACGGGGGDDGGDDGMPTDVTYYQDVKPIFDAKCVNCHSADGIAPFPLDTYADVFESAGAIREAVATGLMPPWPPDPTCNDYFGNRSIDDAQKQLIDDWVAGGALEGDAANPAAPLDVENVQLSRVDLELGMVEAYTTSATATAPDDYRCFVLPWPETTTKYVTGFRARPGDTKLVHHVIAFHAQPGQVAQYQQLDDGEAGPGYTCFGGSGGPSIDMIGSWVPGTLGSDFPAGTGLEILPGSAVILQIHYNVNASPAVPDVTTLEMKLDNTVARRARTLPFTNPSWLSGQNMRIPAGNPDVMHTVQFDPSILIDLSEYDIYAAGLHMHQLGTRAVLERVRGGERACLLEIDDWNFHWQGGYGLRTPVRFQPGDEIRIECHWDNSPENQPYVGGVQQAPRDVYWGEGTRDEMCLGGMYVAPP
jgi:hypothetical protein